MMAGPNITDHVDTQGNPVPKNKHRGNVDHVEDVFVLAVTTWRGLTAKQIRERLERIEGGIKIEVSFLDHQRRKVVCGP